MQTNAKERTKRPFSNCRKGALLGLILCLGAFDLNAENEPAAKSVAIRGTGGPIFGTRAGTVPEVQELRVAMEAFNKRSQGDDFRALESYVEGDQTSPWRIALLNNLGAQYYAGGQFSKAVSVWEKAWNEGKELQEPGVKESVDDAFASLVKIHARLGNHERIEELQAELGNRVLSGSAHTVAINGWDALLVMKNRPDIAFRCGPLALGRVLALENDPKSTKGDDRVVDFHSSTNGTSLKEVFDWAQKLSGRYQMAYREAGSEVIFPAVVHWKAGHFAAVTAQHGNGKYVVKDSTFIDDFVMSPKVLDQEASGYFIVPEGPLPKGWRSVQTEEAGGVWGKGWAPVIDDNPCPTTPCACPKAMTRYSVTLLSAGLRLSDIPVWHNSGFGPAMDFAVHYNQRDANQPPTIPYSNFGPRWTPNYISFVTYDTTVQPWPLTVKIYEKGSGTRTFQFSSTTGTGFQDATSAINEIDGSVLTYDPVNSVGTSTNATFERVFPDGSKIVYGMVDGATGTVARTYLTAEKSRQGPQLSFSWSSTNGNVLLNSITDAVGQATTLSYENSTYPTRITKVTIPGGRNATFNYNADGTLNRITDMGGISSEFEYEKGEVVALLTPYGKTKFEFGFVANDGLSRWIEITDPAGAKERVQLETHGTWVNDSNGVPSGTGIFAETSNLAKGNTLYWNKKAMMNGAGDYTKAETFHWQVRSDNVAVPVIESRKKALENRVYYTYLGQTVSGGPGTHPWPTAIAQLVKSETGSWVTQAYRYEYDDVGNVTKATDPAGRVTIHQYDSSKQNRIATLVQSGTTTQTVWSATYSAPGMPTAITDAAGETTNIAWHSTFKKPTSVTNAKGEVMTLAYYTGTNSSAGRLQTISGDVVNGPIGFTYDSVGRTDTITSGDGYSLNIDYDNLDRPIKTTYPDATFEETVYQRLDPEWTRDRLGRWTHYFYNANQKLSAIVDPANRVTKYDWCSCGAMHGFTDANGNTTSFQQDVQSRFTEKKFADGNKISYTYEEGSSRLQKITDAKGQVKNYTYYKDDNLCALTYTGTSGGALSPPTPGVTLNFDTVFDRLTTMVDGTGTSSYTYHSTGSAGAGRLASVDGPFSNDTISYSYDDLGRQVTRSINGVGETVTYDSKGRMSQVVNALGTFGYGFSGSTARLTGITYPSGTNLGTTMGYLGNSGDNRLEEIIHVLSGSSISKFEYGYDAAGSIVEWKQQTGVGAALERWDLRYDAVDQLEGGSRKTDSSGALLEQVANRYDKLGNRLTKQNDGVVISGSFNALNQLASTTAGGQMLIEGTLDEPAAVTVAGSPAAVNAANEFRAEASVSVGTNTIAIVATDASNNARPKNAIVVVPSGSARTFTYDANGNTTNDGERIYEWDAEDRMTAIVYSGSGNRTEITYDGLSRRARIIEKTSGTATSDLRYLWDRLSIVEERDSTGATTQKQYFDQGFKAGSTKYYYLKDHLGSVRALVDDAGATRGLWNYDLWGKRSANQITSGAIESDVSYTSHFLHGRSGLVLAPLRSFDPVSIRWLSRDPLGERGGINLYGYVLNNPINSIDSLGLSPYKPPIVVPPMTPTPTPVRPGEPAHPPFYEPYPVNPSPSPSPCPTPVDPKAPFDPEKPPSKPLPTPTPKPGFSF